MRRVVITGAGTVNALGHDVPATMAALAAGQGGIGALDLPGRERLAIGIGAAVRGWDPAAHLDPQRLMQCDRFAQLALVAAAEALAQSGLDFNGGLGARTGVILGSAGGGMTTIDDSYRAVHAEGRNRVHPLTVPRLMHSAAPSQIGMAFGLGGPTFAVASACASANHALGLAAQLIRGGAAPVMLAGGAEAMLTFGGLKAWEGLRVLSPTGCRPFAADRDGMVMGEGAAVFVLEDRAHARARGAVILAEIAGFGMCADAGDLVAPQVAGAARAMTLALADAGLEPGQVDHINAHGTGTRVNDRTEAAAITTVFGPRAARIPVAATKALHGHCIGAAGAVELLAVLLALGQGIIAPVAADHRPDPECPLDIVAGPARQQSVRVALSNAFAFGGLNAVLALRRADKDD